MLRIAADYDRLAENAGESIALLKPEASEDPPPSLAVAADAPASNSTTIWITGSAYAAIFGRAPNRTEYDRLGRGYKIALETRVIDRLLSLRAFNDSWSDAILKLVSAEGGWPYSECPSAQTFGEHTLTADKRSPPLETVREGDHERVAAETRATDKNARPSVPGRPGAVDSPGSLSSPRPRSVGLRAAMWVAVILAGSILCDPRRNRHGRLSGQPRLRDGIRTQQLRVSARMPRPPGLDFAPPYRPLNRPARLPR
jgi:hypothetical protein